MAQDVYKQRKSEVEQMNGLIVEKGKENNIPSFHLGPTHNSRLIL
jgi:ketopantoate reductase|tara:strand:+ start:618 stop:752 length:135 start_codon:yes stop_codon:yes gene_type:complete